jgi:hypothetical protein
MIFEKALVDLFYQDMLTTLCGMLAEKADLVWCRKFVKVGLGGRARCAKFACVCRLVKCMDLGWWSCQTEDRSDGWYVAVDIDGTWSGPFPTREAAEARGNKDAAFRRMLLTLCQQEFNVSRVGCCMRTGTERKMIFRCCVRNQEATDDGPDRSAPSDEELQAKLKRRRVSTMCFIGELFKAHLLSSVIVNYCVGELLKDINDEHVEFLCKLFQNVGGQLEQVRTAEVA